MFRVGDTIEIARFVEFKWYRPWTWYWKWRLRKDKAIITGIR